MRQTFITVFSHVPTAPVTMAVSRQPESGVTLRILLQETQPNASLTYFFFLHFFVCFFVGHFFVPLHVIFFHAVSEAFVVYRV